LLLSKVTIVEVLVVVFLGTSEFESLLPQAPNVILENKINPNPTIFSYFPPKNKIIYSHLMAGSDSRQF